MLIYECDMCGKHYKSADSVRVVELPVKRRMLTVPENRSLMICEDCGIWLGQFIDTHRKKVKENPSRSVDAVRFALLTELTERGFT